MAKSNGLGARLLVGGYDLSGDIQAIDSINGGVALLNVTDITQSAMSRITGQRDGSMGFASYMDPANAHPVLSALPTADELMMTLLPPLAISSQNMVAALNAKQVNYDPARGNDGALTQKTEGQGNGYGLEWCMPLTAGLRSDTAATNGATLDCGNSFTTPSVPATTVPVTNTSPLPATVVISGGTVSNVTVNGVTVGTGDGTYTVPSGQAITLTYSAAPTWTWTLQTAWGAQAYLQLTAFTGTSVTVTVQHAPDGSTWTSLMSFTAQTAAPATQRVTVSNTTTVARYLRVITTGTFTAATFAVAVNRNLASGVSF